jgi:hypothetical protein
LEGHLVDDTWDTNWGYTSNHLGINSSKTYQSTLIETARYGENKRGLQFAGELLTKRVRMLVHSSKTVDEPYLSH